MTHHSTHGHRPRRLRLAALLAGATFAALLPSAAEQGPTATATSNRAEPTIVLVHGAWADSSSWSEVVRRLQARDYLVDVPPNPFADWPATPPTSPAS